MKITYINKSNIYNISNRYNEIDVRDLQRGIGAVSAVSYLSIGGTSAGKFNSISNRQ
jgi:hypothetical protein